VTAAGATVADLAAEQADVQARVRNLSADEWLTPTPARLWDVRDTVSHLADVDEMASDTITGGPRALNAIAARSASDDDVTFHGVMRGRRRSGEEVLAWWERAAEIERQLLTDVDPNTRVPWGIGMKATSLIAARLMETWAHGLDIAAALRLDVHDTDRLAHVAWLATRALPYAYTVAGREPPAGELRVELTLPSGAAWTYGSEHAPNRITGTASQYCRVFVRRLHADAATDVVAEGDVAMSALAVARAYL
jgi:uncharacterized protein (TIGR03084 family)